MYGIGQRVKIITVAGVVVVGVLLGSALAAANSIPQTSAGEGDATISGYTITDVHYEFDAGANPSKVDEIKFLVERDASSVDQYPRTIRIHINSIQVRDEDAGRTNSGVCGGPSGVEDGTPSNLYTLECTLFPQPEVGAIDNLRIALAQ